MPESKTSILPFHLHRISKIFTT